MAGSYEKRLMRVLEYIHANPAGDLSLDRLADVAAMSRFHWHRVFHAMTGETCAQATRRIRLHRAACWLVQTGDPVAEVAKKSGYPSAQSFTRAFGEVFGMSPGKFRKRGDMTSPFLQLRKGEYPVFPVEIITAPPDVWPRWRIKALIWKSATHFRRLPAFSPRAICGRRRKGCWGSTMMI